MKMLLFISLLFTGCITRAIIPPPELPPRPDVSKIPEQITEENIDLTLLELLFILEAWESWADTVEKLLEY